MTVEPKRQKRPYSYYEKTINEYSYTVFLLRRPFSTSEATSSRLIAMKISNIHCHSACCRTGNWAVVYLRSIAVRQPTVCSRGR